MEAFTSLCQGNMTCSPAKALRGISASKGTSAQGTGAWVCVISLPLLNILEMPSTEGNLGSDLFKSNRSSQSLSCFLRSWGSSLLDNICVIRWVRDTQSPAVYGKPGPGRMCACGVLCASLTFSH